MGSSVAITLIVSTGDHALAFFHFAFLSLLLFLLDLIEQPCIILILPGFSKRIFFCKVVHKRRNKEMKRTQI